MIISFTEPFDIRMHLAAMCKMAEVDGLIQNREHAYLKQCAKRYEAILGFQLDVMDISSIADIDIDNWIKSLKKRPCSARNLIKDLVELAWSDGVILLKEYDRLVEVAKQCGVSDAELHVLINGVKYRHEAEAIIADVVEHGNATGEHKRPKVTIVKVLNEELKRHRKVVKVQGDKMLWLRFWQTVFLTLSAVLFVVLLMVLKPLKQNENQSQNQVKSESCLDKKSVITNAVGSLSKPENKDE